MYNPRLAAQIKKKLNAFFVANEYKKEAEKIAKPLGDELKELLVSNGLENFETDDCVATITRTKNVVFNEDFAIDHFKKLAELDSELGRSVSLMLGQALKTKVYLDQEAIEHSIYNNPELQAEVSKCFEEKPDTIKLLVKKAKRK